MPNECVCYEQYARFCGLAAHNQLIRLAINKDKVKGSESA